MEYTELESSTKHIGTCQDIVKKKAKFAIIGPGSIGSLFSTYLCLKGMDIMIIDYKKERAQSIKRNGLILETADGKRVTTRPKVAIIDELEPQTPEFILLCVKAYSIRSILPQLANLIGNVTSIVTVQNGIDYWEEVHAFYEKVPLLLCSTSHGAHKKASNHVLHAGSGPTYIGPYKKGEDDREVMAAHTLIEIFNEAGLSSKYEEDIYPVLWRKLIVNCAINPLTAITRRKNGQLLEEPGLLDLQEEIVREVLKVSKRVGISIGLSTKEALEIVKEVCLRTSKNVSSMLQDVLHGKQTEIDYINGAVARLGKVHGVDTTVNTILTTLIKASVSKNMLTNPIHYD